MKLSDDEGDGLLTQDQGLEDIEETEYDQINSSSSSSKPQRRKVKVHLHRKPQIDNDDNIENSPYFQVRNGVIDIYPPWKEIARAVFFLVAGSVLLCFARLIQTGKVNAEPGSDIALYVIGSLLFIPGFYVVVLAYKTWRGYPGYTYDYIPHD